MEWKNLSDKAKAIIEWVENPYTHEKETVEIKIGKTFHRFCPKLCGDFSGKDLKCDIPVTKELFQEILNFVVEDNDMRYVRHNDGLSFRLECD